MDLDNFNNLNTLDKQKFLESFIERPKALPKQFIESIKNEEEYNYLASSFIGYYILHNINHPYKKRERELFFEKYEETYIYNSDYILEYAKKSSKSLILFLKKKPTFMWHLISFFENEAVNDEVIEYIENNNLIKFFSTNKMIISPRIELLKLKADINYWSQISKYTDEEIEYLKSIGFDATLIETYKKNSDQYPECLNDIKFILFLLEQNIENAKFIDKKTLNEEVFNYLNNHNYIYQKGDNFGLLKDNRIFKRFLEKGNIQILLSEDIELTEKQVDLLIPIISKRNIDVSNIRNEYVLKYIKLDDLRTMIKEKNIYNLETRYFITSLGRSLEQLSKIFSENDIQIIIREIIKNDYYINMMGILENIDIIKFQNLYNRLFLKENKISSHFNFYFFIKITDYLSKNLSLVNELNKFELDDNIITNLLLAINYNDYVNYEELNNYQNVLKEKVNSTYDNLKDKILKLFVNATKEEVKGFLDNIIDVNKLLYLQLEFKTDSLEYKLLDLYLIIVKKLELINDEKISLQDFYNELINDLNFNPLIDLKTMENNILKMYSISYYNLNSKERLREEGRCEVIGNAEIIDLNGAEFCFFLHNPNFNMYDDFDSTMTDDEYYHSMKGRGEKNYICTCFVSDLVPNKLLINGYYIYDMENIDSLIAFGNKDIFVDYSLQGKPLIRAENSFVNPIDMAFFRSTVGYTDTEFDFLRYDNHNQKLNYGNYIIVDSKEKAFELAKKSKQDIRILVFDIEKHQKLQKEQIYSQLQNINNLSAKQLYKIIALSSTYEVDELIKQEIIKKIEKMSEKEQIVLFDAIEKYNFIEKNSKRIL